MKEKRQLDSHGKMKGNCIALSDFGKYATPKKITSGLKMLLLQFFNAGAKYFLKVGKLNPTG